MNLKEEILRINILMLEDSFPSEYKRRLNFDKIEKLINQKKWGSFEPNKPVSISVAKTIKKTTTELIKDLFPAERGFSLEEINNIINTLSNFLFPKYEEELTQYFEERKNEYEDREPSEYKYVFYKHDKPLGVPGWRGFSEGFDYFNELVHKYGEWLDIDWAEVKHKLDTKGPTIVKVSKVGDPGNTWGYDFTIEKRAKKK